MIIYRVASGQAWSRSTVNMSTAGSLQFMKGTQTNLGTTVGSIPLRDFLPSVPDSKHTAINPGGRSLTKSDGLYMTNSMSR